MKRTAFFPSALAAIVALASIIGLFVPYIGTTSEYAAYLESIADQKPFDTADIRVSDMVDMSLYDYAKTYWQAGEEILGDRDEGVFYTVLFASPGIFGVFALLCALNRKGIPLILQSLIIGGLFYAINWDTLERGIMPHDGRVWGMAYHLYYPIAGILLICGIWIFIAKHNAKHKMKKLARAKRDDKLKHAA